MDYLKKEVYDALVRRENARKIRDKLFLIFKGENPISETNLLIKLGKKSAESFLSDIEKIQKEFDIGITSFDLHNENYFLNIYLPFDENIMKERERESNLRWKAYQGYVQFFNYRREIDDKGDVIRQVDCTNCSKRMDCNTICSNENTLEKEQMTKKIEKYTQLELFV